MRYIIGRPIEGVTLNGNEYVLDNDGNEMIFDSIEDAVGFLMAYGYKEDDIENQCVVFEEVKE